MECLAAMGGIFFLGFIAGTREHLWSNKWSRATLGLDGRGRPSPHKPVPAQTSDARRSIKFISRWSLGEFNFGIVCGLSFLMRGYGTD
jgi:hypothetical protein